MKAGEVLKILKISRARLSQYCRDGLIKYTIKTNGQYDYDETSVYTFLHERIQSLKDLTFEELGMDVLSYKTPQSLLQAYVEFCQEISPRYSYRHFARRLGNTNPGYFQELIKGTRLITDRVREQLILLMGLKGNTVQYFELLVHQSRLSKDSVYYQECETLLNIIRNAPPKEKSFDESRIDCEFSLLHMVIREMAALKGGRIDLSWLQRHLTMYHLPFTKKDILQCIEDLKRNDLLEEKDGDLVVKHQVITFKGENLVELLMKQQQEVILNSVYGLKTPPKQREYGFQIVPTTPERIAIAKQKLKKVRQEIGEILEMPEGESTRLVSFSFQLYPLVTISDEDGTE